MTGDSSPERVAVYRLYDTDGDLLYVGVASHVGRRWDAHMRLQPWWPDVQRQTVEWHPDRRAAETAESAAIRTESPKRNRKGLLPESPGPVRRRPLITREADGCMVASEDYPGLIGGLWVGPNGGFHRTMLIETDSGIFFRLYAPAARR